MRGRLRKILTVLTSVALLGIAVPVVAEFFIEWAREEGWYSQPGDTAERLMSIAADIALSHWTLYPVTLLLGVTIGLWVDTLLRRSEKAKPSKEDRLEAIGHNLVGICVNLDKGLARLEPDITRYTAARLNSLEESLRKEGLEPPKVAQAADMPTFMRTWALYASLVGTLLKDGHYEAAKDKAAEIASGGEAFIKRRT